MSGTWVRGRAADRFDAAVGGAHGSGAEGVAPADLVALVGALRALPEVTPRPERAAALRERLMVEADRLADLRAVADPAPSATRAPSGAAGDDLEERLRLRLPRRHPRRLAVLAGTVAALGATTSVGVAAQSALPGESLYPVKRALEDARSEVTRDESAQGELLLGNASQRLDEAASLLAGDDAAALQEVGPTLDGFSAQAADGAGRLLAEHERTGDRALVQELRDFTAVSRGELDDMALELPQSARAAWSRALAAVRDIDAEAFAACPLCVAAPGDLASQGEALSAGDDLPGVELPVVTPDGARSGEPRGGDAGSDGRGSGGDDRRGDGRRGGGGSVRDPGGDRSGGGVGPVDPGPRLPGSPGSGGGLGGLLGDGVTSGLGDGGGSGLGDGLRGLGSGLGDGLGDGLGGALRGGSGGSGGSGDRSGDGSGSGSAKRDRRNGSDSPRRSGGGSGRTEQPGVGLDDLLP